MVTAASAGMIAFFQKTFRFTTCFVYFWLLLNGLIIRNSYSKSYNQIKFEIGFYSVRSCLDGSTWVRLNLDFSESMLEFSKKSWHQDISCTLWKNIDSYKNGRKHLSRNSKWVWIGYNDLGWINTFIYCIQCFSSAAYMMHNEDIEIMC